MYDCVMGLKDFQGAGCILADDMGLGKVSCVVVFVEEGVVLCVCVWGVVAVVLAFFNCSNLHPLTFARCIIPSPNYQNNNNQHQTLQSVTLIWTLLQTGITANNIRTCNRIIVVCPCSLVKNWDNEFIKWLGPGVVKTLALAESDRKTVEKNIDCFVKTKMFNVLICSYETLRTHVGRLTKYKDCCDLLVCDEAHRLKNRENQTSMALNSLPVRRRVLLTGTPMQNDLEEFYAMVDFTNPGILGTQEDFRRKMLYPILRGREPDATEKQKTRMMEIQNDMSTTVNEFILRRVNTLNAQHLPPKLVQVVCCNLTEIQNNMYAHLCNSKAMQHVLDGKQVNCLGSIQMLMKVSCLLMGCGSCGHCRRLLTHLHLAHNYLHFSSATIPVLLSVTTLKQQTAAVVDVVPEPRRYPTPKMRSHQLHPEQTALPSSCPTKQFEEIETLQ